MAIYDAYEDHPSKSKAIEIYKISRKIGKLNLEIEKLIKLNPWFKAEYDFLKKWLRRKQKYMLSRSYCRSIE